MTSDGQPKISSRILKQFLCSDQFFGLRQVPVSLKSITEALAARRVTQSGGGVTGCPVSLASTGGKAARLGALNKDHVQNCQQCRLCEGRNNTVFGAGSPDARLVFVGEGPGFHEDRQGVAFRG